MKRIEKIIKQVESGELSGENLITELTVLKALIDNVENHLKSLKKTAMLDSIQEEEDTGSYARSIAYGTALELLTINMEEGEE